MFVVGTVLVLVGIYFSFPKIISAASFLIKVFLPFILGYLFSLLVNPLARFLHKKLKIPKGICAIVVMILTLGIIGSLIAFGVIKIVGEVRNLYQQLPVIIANAQESFRMLGEKWTVFYSEMPTGVQDMFTNMYEDLMSRLYVFIDDKSSPIVSYAGSFAKSLPNIFISFVVFMLSSFFMVSHSESVAKVTDKIFGGRNTDKLADVKQNIKKYLGGYLKAQLTIMSIAFLLIFTGLTILDVDYALLIALAIAIFDGLPFFGSGAILWPWAIISLLDAQYKLGAGLIIVYFSVLFTRQFIEPKIVSSNIGTSPLATLAAMYIGYKIFSIGGMILGPVVMMFCISLYKAHVFDGLIDVWEVMKMALGNTFRRIKRAYESTKVSVIADAQMEKNIGKGETDE